jgi:hypothetical protein
MNLKFEKSKLNFKDPNKKMIQAVIHGHYTQKEIRHELQKISDDLKKHNKNARVGVAMHYKNVNTWAPAIFSNAGDYAPIWSSKDSPETEHVYDNDIIDGLEFYVINNNNNIAKDHKFMKPMKEKIINKNLFA